MGVSANEILRRLKERADEKQYDEKVAFIKERSLFGKKFDDWDDEMKVLFRLTFDTKFVPTISVTYKEPTLEPTSSDKTSVSDILAKLRAKANRTSTTNPQFYQGENI